ncbi:MAG: glycosyltransferase [Spirulinaceae cyanobacterium SM2_1_0]|nr:glycosyltransferase [Spirulinaceae cyanobacterium SM2_1_0]
MKVLHVIPSIAAVRGGPTQVVLNLGRALRDRGVEVEIATTNDSGATVLDVPLQQRCEYRGLPVWFFPRFGGEQPGVSLGGDRSFLFSAPWTRWLWQNLRHYDVLDHHYLFSYGPTCAGAIARWQGIPYTVRTMGQLSPWALAQSRRKKQLYSRLIERRNLNRAAAVHCTSDGEAQDVRNFGVSAPTLVLPLGVQVGATIPDAGQQLRQRYGIAPTRPILLFLSRLHYKKRPELLIEALGRWRSQQPEADFHLLLAGTAAAAEYEAQLRQQVQDCGLGDRVTFAGFVTGADKELVLQGSDLFALPSYAENFAIAVAEAMVAGLPVVVTPAVQIAPAIVAAQAGLVVPGEAAAWQAALASLLTDASQRQHFGANGRQLATERYSWPVIAAQLTTAYMAIAARQPLPTGNLVPQSSL